MARREARSGGPTGIGRPYIVRNIPPYDVLGEENLVRIETAADRILAEVGLQFRDDPVALDHWKRAGAEIDGELVKFEPGMLRDVLKTAPRGIRSSRPQQKERRAYRRTQRRLLAVIWLPLRRGHG